MSAIYKRELRAYYNTPLGYIFTAIFLCLSGILFSVSTLQRGAESNIAYYFTYLLISFVIVIPLLTMKLFSEERKTKTDQLLLTSPVSLTGIVLAKFLAAFTVFAVTYFISAFSFIALYVYGEPNTAMLIGNSVGILLLGGACISIGVFVSSLTENQLIAAIGAMAINLAFIMVNYISGYVNNTAVRVVLSWVSLIDRYDRFGNGIFDFNAVFYYVSISVVFLFLTVRVFEKRRWS